MKPAWNVCVTLVALSFISGTAFAANVADNYPSRPVRIVAGSPGSTADITARFIGQKLSERFKQQMVIDNRASAACTMPRPPPAPAAISPANCSRRCSASNSCIFRTKARVSP